MLRSLYLVSHNPLAYSLTLIGFSTRSRKMASMRYTHALVCRVPDAFKSKSENINLDEARKEHEEYCRILRELGLDVIELPPDEHLPECVFVEDTAVVCNGTALICRPGKLDRQKEVDIIRTIIKKELELPIVEIADPKALIDGGDVLYTGREFFVGLSSRTNEAGARALAAAFPEFPVTPIRVKGKLHLKSVMSMAGSDVLCVSSGRESQEMLRRIEREATFRYRTVTVMDDDAANCLYINGTLVHRSEFPESVQIFEEKIDYPRVPVKFTELSKANCGLTSCCILIKKSKHIKKL